MLEFFQLVVTPSNVWILTLGFLFGLQHATETDHLAAVSTIVSERKTVLGSAIVGGFGESDTRFLYSLPELWFYCSNFSYSNSSAERARKRAAFWNLRSA